MPNLTVQTTATSTLQSEAANQSLFYLLSTIAVIAAILIALLIFAARKKHITLKPNQQNTLGIILVLTLIVTITAIAATPINQNQMPLSFRDINVFMQSLWMSLLLVSMWFRKKGNYFIHGILAIVVVSITITSFLGVLILSPMDSGSTSEYFASPIDIAVLLAHSIVSFPALAFGVWLVALWRPNSASFAAKSKRAAQLTTVFWILSYVVGILDYLLLRTNFA